MIHATVCHRPSLIIFGSDSTAEGAARAIREILAEEGGTGFVLTYLEHVCGLHGDPTCHSIDRQRATMQVVMQHETATQERINALQSEISAGFFVDEKGDAGAVRLKKSSQELDRLKSSLPHLHRGFQLMLNLAARDESNLKSLFPLWVDPGPTHMPSTLLAGAAKQLASDLTDKGGGYRMRRNTGALNMHDLSYERTILAMLQLFVRLPEVLTGFQNLAPVVFDIYLEHGSELRDKVCKVLQEASQPDSIVEKVRNDDTLVKQPFFWSTAGMMLFGGHPDLKVPSKLKVIINKAVSQQPQILVTFLQQATDKVFDEVGNPSSLRGGSSRSLRPSLSGNRLSYIDQTRGGSPSGMRLSIGNDSNGIAGMELGALIKVSLRCLLDYVGQSNSLAGPDIDGKRKGVLDALQIVLIASTRVFDQVFPKGEFTF